MAYLVVAFFFINLVSVAIVAVKNRLLHQHYAVKIIVPKRRFFDPRHIKVNIR
jgi:hypothetical protein